MLIMLLMSVCLVDGEDEYDVVLVFGGVVFISMFLLNVDLTCGMTEIK